MDCSFGWKRAALADAFDPSATSFYINAHMRGAKKKNLV